MSNKIKAFFKKYPKVKNVAFFLLHVLFTLGYFVKKPFFRGTSDDFLYYVISNIVGFTPFFIAYYKRFNRLGTRYLVNFLCYYFVILTNTLQPGGLFALGAIVWLSLLIESLAILIDPIVQKVINKKPNRKSD
jgi:hypothetical protein